MLARIAVSACCAFGALACASTNHATGTVGGKSWDGAVQKATYCEHCGGGTLVEVVFQRENELGTVVLAFEDCISDHTVPIRQANGARLSYFEHPNGARVEATKGELRLDVCTEKELRGRFDAELSDGGKISGTLATPLELDAGYD